VLGKETSTKRNVLLPASKTAIHFDSSQCGCELHGWKGRYCINDCPNMFLLTDGSPFSCKEAEITWSGAFWHHGVRAQTKEEYVPQWELGSTQRLKRSSGNAKQWISRHNLEWKPGPSGQHNWL